jgi:hypothetical protein
LERIAADLYEDKIAGTISETAFAALINQNEQERQARQARLDEVRAALTAMEEALLNVSQWVDAVRRNMSLSDLCRIDVEELIDHIEIGESDYTKGFRQQDVKIFWRFVGRLNGDNGCVHCAFPPGVRIPSSVSRLAMKLADLP